MTGFPGEEGGTRGMLGSWNSWGKVSEGGRGGGAIIASPDLCEVRPIRGPTVTLAQGSCNSGGDRV